MTKNRKLLIAILIIATVVLAGLSILISTIINNNNLQTQTGAQTNPILANCNNTLNTCTIPAGVCNPSKVHIHFCNELKRDNEKCISANPIEIPTSPVASGQAVNLNDYLSGVSCGTVQMYLELENSGINSLGACGTTMKRFATACGAGTSAPVSFPVSSPVSFPTSNNTNTSNNNSGSNTNNGNTQLADPQFRVTNSFAASCDVSGDALLKYTISVANISTVSGTITKVEEVIDPNLAANGINPTNVSNSGTTAGNKITWAESLSNRTYNANQTKTLTYEIRIPKDKLASLQNGTNSSATVIYNTSNTTGNTNTFALLSKHSCAIPTTNTATSTSNANNSLPNTSISDDFKLFLVGIGFILIALIIFRFQIGEDTIANLIGSKYRRKN